MWKFWGRDEEGKRKVGKRETLLCENIWGRAEVKVRRAMVISTDFNLMGQHIVKESHEVTLFANMPLKTKFELLETLYIYFWFPEHNFWVLSDEKITQKTSQTTCFLWVLLVLEYGLWKLNDITQFCAIQPTSKSLIHYSSVSYFICGTFNCGNEIEVLSLVGKQTNPKFWILF